MITLEDLEKIRPFQLGALQYLHDTCEKHGLKYTLWGGTALGAVRHGGFIPWDVDADIALLRPDFDKLVKILLEENRQNTGYFLQSRENTPKNYIKYHPVFRVNNTYISFSKNRNNMNNGIFIDIFPLDYFPLTKLGNIIVKKNIKILNYLGRLKNAKIFAFSPRKIGIFKQMFLVFSKIILIPPFKIIPANFLYLWFDLIRKKNCSDKNADYIVSLSTGYSLEKMKFNRGIIEIIENIKFENLNLKILSKKKEYLHHLYGKNYMKIPEEGSELRRIQLLEHCNISLFSKKQ